MKTLLAAKTIIVLCLSLSPFPFALAASVLERAPDDSLNQLPRKLIRTESLGLKAAAEAIKNPPSSKNPLEFVSAFRGKSPTQVMQALPANMQAAVLTMNKREGLGYHRAPVRCSSVEETDENIKVKRQYQEDSKRSCAHASGMWSQSGAAPVLRYKFETIATILGLRRGHRVLDWGAGCGHQLDLIARQYGFDAIGVDLLDSNTNWAMTNLQHLSGFCTADGRKLPFMDESFDAVVSNAALYHVESADGECKAMQEVFRVLRPGGCAWFGWTGMYWSGHPNFVSAEHWTGADGCFKDHEGVTVTTMNEWELFGVSEYEHKETYSLFFCKAEKY